MALAEEARKVVDEEPDQAVLVLALRDATLQRLVRAELVRAAGSRSTAWRSMCVPLSDELPNSGASLATSARMNGV